MIEIIENISDLEAFKESINTLADNSNMPLLRYEWLMNTARIVCPPAKLYFIVLTIDNEIKAIAPLVEIQNNFIKRLEVIGTSFHKEPGGFLYRDVESLQNLIEVILKLNKSFYIKGIKIHSPESFALESVLFNNRKCTFKIDASIPFLPIIENWENFQKKISPSRRSSLRRLERIGKEMGDYKIEILTPTIDQVDKYIQDVLDVEASGWKQRMGTAMKSNSKLGIFFKNYSHEASELGLLRLCFLRINNQAVAAQIGLIYANRFWSLKIGYDESFSKCSPGILLMNEVIRFAFENKLDAVEFLGSDEQWLHLWTSHIRKLITYNIYPSAISSISDLAIDYSRSFYRKINYQLSKKLKFKQLSHA